MQLKLYVTKYSFRHQLHTLLLQQTVITNNQKVLSRIDEFTFHNTNPKCDYQYKECQKKPKYATKMDAQQIVGVARRIKHIKK